MDIKPVSLPSDIVDLSHGFVIFNALLLRSEEQLVTGKMQRIVSSVFILGKSCSLARTSAAERVFGNELEVLVERSSVCHFT